MIRKIINNRKNTNIIYRITLTHCMVGIGKNEIITLEDIFAVHYILHNFLYLIIKVVEKISSLAGLVVIILRVIPNGITIWASICYCYILAHIKIKFECICKDSANSYVCQFYLCSRARFNLMMVSMIKRVDRKHTNIYEGDQNSNVHWHSISLFRSLQTSFSHTGCR